MVKASFIFHCLILRLAQFWPLALLMVALFFIGKTHAIPAKQLNIGVLYSAKGHQGIYQELASRFNQQYPDTQINFVGLLDAEYKQAVPQWLNGKGNIDVFYWQAGERLFHYAKQGLIHPITELWQKKELSEKFPPTIAEVVFTQDNYFAVPFTYYTWGMFYSKPLLSKLGIDAPTSWQQLLQMCQLANLHNVNPIIVAGKESWLPAAWFDYINLRLNGIKFHQQLLRGEISYLDERVRAVFEHWLMLKNAKCFNDSSYLTTKWQNIMPQLVRQYSVSTLLANFIDMHVPEHLKSKLIYRPFPVIDKKVPVYEDVPVDVFAIVKASKQKQLAEKFLLFIADSKVQRDINHALIQSAPNIKSGFTPGHFVSKNQKILMSAAGITQYFDRDMPQHMVADSLKAIGNFMHSGDIDVAVTQLESIRTNTLKNKD